MRTASVCLISCLLLGVAGCLPDGHWKERGPTRPAELDDGWSIASPESVGLDVEVLRHIHDELLREDANFGTLGFLVVKNDQLVFETYVQDAADRDRLHHLQSMTKSVTSLAFGMAHDDGTFPDLDAPIQDFLPAAQLAGLDPRVKRITLEQLLTMRSGIDTDNDTYFVELLVDRPKNPLRYILSKGLFAEPGKRFRYRDADPQILAYVMEAALGERERAFVNERLLDPLGITEFYWEAMPDGATIGGTSLYLKPRDVARLGQLALECVKGTSDLISEEYCLDAVTTHVPPGQTLGKRLRRGYGYYFWTLPDYDAFAAWGHGGQFFLVVPDQDLVLVQVALPDTDYLNGGWLEDFVELTRPLFCPTCPAVAP